MARFLGRLEIRRGHIWENDSDEELVSRIRTAAALSSSGPVSAVFALDMAKDNLSFSKQMSMLKSFAVCKK